MIFTYIFTAASSQIMGSDDELIPKMEFCIKDEMNMNNYASGNDYRIFNPNGDVPHHFVSTDGVPSASTNALTTSTPTSTQTHQQSPISSTNPVIPLNAFEAHDRQPPTLDAYQTHGTPAAMGIGHSLDDDDDDDEDNRCENCDYKIIRFDLS